MPSTGNQHRYGMTDVGRERDINEDQFLVADLRSAMIVHQCSLAPARNWQSAMGDPGGDGLILRPG